MRYTGIQPHYFPRLHYFARILNTDLFMVRDDVQFVKKHKYPNGKNDKSYQADTPVKARVGRQFLTVPVKHAVFGPIKKTEISYDTEWPEDHLKTLEFLYRKSPHYDELFIDLGHILEQDYANLADLNMSTIYWALLRLLGERQITKEKLTLGSVNRLLATKKIFRMQQIKFASESPTLMAQPSLGANEKILCLCRENGITQDYCGGTAVAAYMDQPLFKKNGINIVVQDWHCREYPQRFTRELGFFPNLSIIDLLMNVSVEEARKILMGS